MGPALTGASGPGDPFTGRSLWADQAVPRRGGPARDPVTQDEEVDVVVVGGGYTGLWTAYYLALAAPRWRVLVVEQETVGFGASGRNGGWCSALFPTGAQGLARRHGRSAALAMRAAMRATVDEVVAVCAREGIDADVVKGGTLTLARTPPQLARARAQASAATDWGDEVALLTAAEAQARVGAADVLGATWAPDCARVHPMRLVQGLADAVERRGVRIAEHTRATSLGPGAVVVEGRPVGGDSARDRAPRPSATVRARHVVRATEAWTSRLPGLRRAVAPVYSLVLATAPLPAATWSRVGLARYETFTDHRHLVVYGQRTADDRVVFGGRGAPYHWGSAISPHHDVAPRVFAALERTLGDLLPDLRGVPVTHRWGGPLGVPRDWHASVGLEPDGVARAGGYVGDGVATSNLAGRTLADLLTGRDTDLTRLPWVGHRSRPWEPEPLRWLGVNAGLRAMTLADAEEHLTGRQSVVARAMAPLLGH